MVFKGRAYYLYIKTKKYETVEIPYEPFNECNRINFSNYSLCNATYNNQYSFNSNVRCSKLIRFYFPDTLVLNYEGLIDNLNLPDKDDRHVLAAAIKVNANIIVTNNLKDFPDDYLDSFGLKAVCADDFLTDIIDLNPKIALQAFKDLVLNRKNPAMDEFQVLESFRKNGLNQTADYLHALL